MLAARVLRSARRAPRLSSCFHAGARVEDEAKAPAAETDPIVEAEGEGGFLRYLQNLDATAAVPIAGLGAIAMIQNDVLQMDAEMQIAALFVAFVGTAYSQGGDAAAKMLDATSDQILEEQNKAEEAEIEALALVRALHEKQTTVHGDMAAVFEAQSALMDGLVAAKSNKLKHDVKNQVSKMLDALVVQEANVQRDVQSQLVAAAVGSVRAQATADAMKASALDEALQTIANPEGGAKDDAIGKLFSDYFAGFNSRLDAARNEDNAVPADVAADMEATVSALNAANNVSVDYKAPASIKIGDF